MYRTGLGCAVIVLATGVAQAGPIHIEFRGTATGSIGGVVKTGADIKFSFDVDTANVQTVEAGTVKIYKDVLNGGIDFGGVLATFNGPLNVFNNQEYEVVGFGEKFKDYLNIQLFGLGLDTYGFTTPYGPESGTQSNLVFNAVPTSAGNLSLSAYTNAVFQVGPPPPPPPPPSSVPEPSTLVLGVFGLVCCGATTWRKRRVAV